MDTKKLYIEGYQIEEKFHCPLPSSVILFILRYCQYETLSIVFVGDEQNKQSVDYCCSFETKILQDLDVSFVCWNDLPEMVKTVSLPSLHQPDMKLVRSGLCIVLRHIIKEAHEKSPSLNVIDLLGFKCGCMKMCAEVSGWTKLCEVELPKSVTQLLEELRICSTSSQPTETCITLPCDLVKLEGHFTKKCIVHNEDKKQRADLSRLKHYFNDDKKGSTAINSSSFQKIPKSYPHDDHETLDSTTLDTLSLDGNKLYVEQTVTLSHGVRKYRVKKTRNAPSHVEGLSCVQQDESSADGLSRNVDAAQEEKSSQQAGKTIPPQGTFDMSELQDVLESLIHFDIEYVHVYSEGSEMTVADLIIWTYLYYLLEMTGFDCQSLSAHLPCVMHWASHMGTIPTVVKAGNALGFRMQEMKEAFSICSLPDQSSLPMGHHQERPEELKSLKSRFLFTCEEERERDEDIELSRSAKMKHRAIKPEVKQALEKFENGGLQPMEGSHPRGDAVQIEWDTLPKGVHPKQGDVPAKRTVRKCQQLENLATAIQAVARPGDVIVDFCSGGGHLGIVLAYLLPECQVALVENKEESLLRSCSRLKSLGLSNVTLYQCNMDYFTGKFDIGTCLHACGSATDMVLQLCLQSEASFVICPCCYGRIQNTHLLSYPRSKYFASADVTYKDFLTLGHAADQTEFNIALEEQGRKCMDLIDTDRAHLAKELDYTVSLCSLKPLNCTPKNNLLIGVPNLKNSKDQ